MLIAILISISISAISWVVYRVIKYWPENDGKDRAIGWVHKIKDACCRGQK